MRPTIPKLLPSLALYLVSVCVSAAPGGQLPIKIITGEVAQEQRWGVDAPAYLRSVTNPERLTRAIKAQDRHTDALMNERGVRGTAVGWNQNDEPVVKVYIDTSSSEAGIPETLDGIAVMVEYTGKLYALSNPCSKRESGSCVDDQALQLQANSASEPGRTERQARPVPIGVSAANFNGGAGTLGCRVSGGCHSYALSNAHVFETTPDDNILQPGPLDGGLNPSDSIGYLSVSVPIEYSTTATNKVDAAIALTGPSLVGRGTPSDGYGVPRYNVLAPSVNLNVMKYGRTSGLTNGYIDAVNATLYVDYDNGTARFVDQIIIKGNDGNEFSLGGDSGSLVVASGGEYERRPVGLVFAAGNGITAANPIGDVLSELGVTIDGE